MDKFPLPIVCFSTEDWDTRLPTNKKQIMSRLAQTGTKVIWIDTVGTRLPKLHKSDMARILRRIRAKSDVGDQSSIHRISPLVIPGGPAPLNRYLLCRKIINALQNNNIIDYVLWIYNPYAINYIEALPTPSLIIYHCVDDLSLVPGARGSSIRESEKKVLKKADLVFCTSPALLKKCKAVNPKTFLQPNVADFKHFNTASNENPELPLKLKNLKNPIVAFAGNLVEYKIDFPLIAETARKLTHAQFVLIGPEWEGNPSGTSEDLKNLNNVHFTGMVEYDDLPQFLAAADVLMMPYRLTDHTENIFPLKFYEFLATGKPVVSTSLPALTEFEGLVPLTTSTKSFAEAIENAINGKQNKHQEERLNLASQNTWEVRITSMIQIVSECFDTKKQQKR